MRKAPYARKDNTFGARYNIGIGGHGDIRRSRRFQRVSNRLEIARAIVDQRDALSHPKSPWSTE